jgi:hypothetical protein
MKLGTKSFKVTLPDGTIVYHKVFDGGSNKVFIIHVKEVLSLIKRKNYYNYDEKAVMKKNDCTQRFEKAQKKSDTASPIPQRA